MSTINRKHNHTVSQNVAGTAPKWVEVGNGLLRHRNGNYAKVGHLGRLVPQNRHQIRFHLGVIAAVKAAAEAVSHKVAA